MKLSLTQLLIFVWFWHWKIISYKCWFCSLIVCFGVVWPVHLFDEGLILLHYFWWAMTVLSLQIYFQLQILFLVYSLSIESNSRKGIKSVMSHTQQSESNVLLLPYWLITIATSKNSTCIAFETIIIIRSVHSLIYYM